MDDRETVVVKDSKERINKIKEKYNNLQMSDSTAKKIIALEITNNVLSVATSIAGVVTVVDYVIPDGIPFLDEAILTGITALLGTAKTIVANNIDSLAKDGSPDMKKDEAEKLGKQIFDVVNAVKAKKNSYSMQM